MINLSTSSDIGNSSKMNCNRNVTLYIYISFCFADQRLFPINCHEIEQGATKWSRVLLRSKIRNRYSKDDNHSRGWISNARSCRLKGWRWNKPKNIAAGKRLNHEERQRVSLSYRKRWEGWWKRDRISGLIWDYSATAERRYIRFATLSLRV